jgi:hypothetical protein
MECHQSMERLGTELRLLICEEVRIIRSLQ